MNLAQAEQAKQSRTAVEPFLKWAGGKRLLLREILPWLPEPATRTSRYREPFLGGGAVFFAKPRVSSTLSDCNSELVETYLAVRDDVEKVIDCLRRMGRTETDFYRIRQSVPRSAFGRAARFIYLNKTCFNGLYRVNLRGEFNVPFGRHPEATVICNRAQLRAASAALQRVDIEVLDFRDALALAKPGDVVYCDPPYITGHRDNGFVEYNARVFSWQDQGDLATLARQLVDQGIAVVISNGDHESVAKLYRGTGFQLHRIRRNSTMAGSSKHRQGTSELLVVGGI